MKVVIIEDEPQAAQRLEKLIKVLEPGAEIIVTMDSVKQAVAWFKKDIAADLIFMDIQLADGISFQIFEQCEVKSPVIFTTAFDAYALKAFKVNSIDYILKPVDSDELKVAILKFKQLTRGSGDTKVILENIGQAVQMLTKRHKTRFMIKVGEHLRTVEVENILYFYSQEKTTFCVTQEGRNFILDYSMEQLEEMIDPERYYRINRKYLVASNAIQDIITYTNSRLRLVLKNSDDNDVIVARERVQEFKDWLDN